MFKALLLPENLEINLLTRGWIERINELRRLDRADQLVCLGCRQPVRVRACVYKRKHFAHKHLQNCPYQLESPELLQARAVLYETLAAQVGEANVSIEQVFPGAALPRPVDVWVSQGDQAWGYWIIDRRMPPDQRERLLKALKRAPGAVHFIFVSNMRHRDEKDARRLYLTTTEREFMAPTACDAAWQNVYDLPGQTLHYLDAQSQTLTTYRSLILAHHPQLFAGHPLSHPLAEVQAISDEGGWLHPGEEQRVIQHLREVADRQQTEARLKQVGQRLRQAAAGWEQSIPSPGAKNPTFTPQSAPQVRTPFQREAPCRVCGKVSSDWVSYDGRTKTCLCRECANKG